MSEINVNASNASTPSTTSKKVGLRDEPGVRTVERKSLPDVSFPGGSVMIDEYSTASAFQCKKGSDGEYGPIRPLSSRHEFETVPTSLL